MVHPTVKVIYETMSELDTADIKLEGVTKLLQYPEYSDVSRVRELLGVLEEKDRLLDVISTNTTSDDDIHVYIGGDDSGEVMSDTSMIFKTINIGGKQLSVGVIGPKRMNYSKVIEMLNGLANGIDKLFCDGALLTDGSDD
jgi:heat-inducible transcriptional repressor